MEAETFQEWLLRVGNERRDPIYKTMRHGQYLWVRLPNRFIGSIPTAYDPFYNDDNIDVFLDYIEHRW